MVVLMWKKKSHKRRERYLKILGRLMQREELAKNSAPDDQLQSVVAAAYTSCPKGLYLLADGLSVHLLALLFCAAGFPLTIRSCQVYLELSKHFAHCFYSMDTATGSVFSPFLLSAL